MKSFLNTAAVALVAAFTASAAGANMAQADTVWVPVENWSTSDVIYDIRIAPETEGGWGPNHVYGGGQWPGYITDAWVDVWQTCYVDILIETDWMTHEAYGVNICDTAAIVVGDGEAWIEYYDDAHWDF